MLYNMLHVCYSSIVNGKSAIQIVEFKDTPATVLLAAANPKKKKETEQKY